MPRKPRIALVASLLVLGLALTLSLILRNAGPRRTSSFRLESSDKTAKVAPSDVKPADMSRQLTSPLASKPTGLPAEQSKSLFEAVGQWMEAYASPTSAPIVAIMERSGIERPLSWSNPEQTEENYRDSLLIFSQIYFTPGDVLIFVPGPGNVHPYANGPHMCGTRDAARSVLSTPNARARLTIREAIFGGGMPDAEGNIVPVSFGITMAWDSSRNQWIPIQTCFYNLPAGVVGRAPVL